MGKGEREQNVTHKENTHLNSKCIQMKLIFLSQSVPPRGVGLGTIQFFFSTGTDTGTSNSLPVPNGTFFDTFPLQ